MAILSKDAWLTGSDLEEKTIEVPALGGEVKIKALAAAYTNEASSTALKWVTDPKGEQIASIDTAKMEVLQFSHGVIEPKFTVEEAELVAQRFGPSFKTVVNAIDEISGVNKEAIEAANRRFRDSGRSSSGSNVADANGTGDPGPDVHPRVVPGAGKDA